MTTTAPQPIAWPPAQAMSPLRTKTRPSSGTRTPPGESFLDDAVLARLVQQGIRDLARHSGAYAAVLANKPGARLAHHVAAGYVEQLSQSGRCCPGGPLPPHPSRTDRGTRPRHQHIRRPGHGTPRPAPGPRVATMTDVRVLLVDDQTPFLRAMSAVVEEAAGFEVDRRGSLGRAVHVGHGRAASRPGADGHEPPRDGRCGGHQSAASASLAAGGGVALDLDEDVGSPLRCVVRGRGVRHQVGARTGPAPCRVGHRLGLKSTARGHRSHAGVDHLSRAAHPLLPTDLHQQTVQRRCRR